MSDQPFTVIPVGKTTTGLAGRSIEFPSGPCELEMHLVEVEPGAAIGRHRHPGPCSMYVLEGTIVTQSDDGTRRRFGAGESFVEDAWEWIDNQNPGDTPARFLAVVAGAASEPKVLFDD